MSLIRANRFITFPKISDVSFSIAGLSPYGHFDAAINGSVTHATNAVSNWANQSGAMNDLAQSVAAQKPVYDDGNDKITFNSDALIADMTGEGYNNTDDWEIYMVMQYTSEAQQVFAGFYSNVNTAWTQEWGTGATTSTIILWRGDGTTGGDTATPSITSRLTTVKYIVKMSANSTDVDLDVGGQTGNLSSTKSDVILDFILGNRAFTGDAWGMKAAVHELVVMDRLLSAGEETDLRSFLNTKWSI